ncbi:hypothetical protein TSUD_290570 [Trifolium subterraneum]|uniref:Uncharacterized protein n=1 Tax=Trifolium subterraneum TaxID=3900 RepID=A0A2Z6MTI9_TRISU|nr:hypothetical protein TSUD_290570 [Trifolium subterraneum]
MSPSLAAIGRRNEQMMVRRIRERKRAIGMATKRSQKEGSLPAKWERMFGGELTESFALTEEVD